MKLTFRQWLYRNYWCEDTKMFYITKDKKLWHSFNQVRIVQADLAKELDSYPKPFFSEGMDWGFYK